MVQENELKSNELRLGNWVADPLGYYLKVNQLGHPHTDDFIYASNDNGFGQNGFYGIPLTPKILEMCGFTCIKNHIYEIEVKYGFLTIGKLLEQKEFKLFELQATDNEGERRITVIGLDDIKSLHQLQNLYFALTGQELAVQLSEPKVE